MDRQSLAWVRSSPRRATIVVDRFPWLKSLVKSAQPSGSRGPKFPFVIVKAQTLAIASECHSDPANAGLAAAGRGDHAKRRDCAKIEPTAQTRPENKHGQAEKTDWESLAMPRTSDERGGRPIFHGLDNVAVRSLDGIGRGIATERMADGMADGLADELFQ